ncbi:MAG: hypothetical protein QOG62_2479 [Thermoleophilaceae bacterium]|jgi:hypothetical protein|nr:hypothetical protein [Thermoleophilaceae bacterium]
MPAKDVPIEYPLRLAVDSEAFLVKQDLRQAGVYHYDWISGPNTGYGFMSGIAELDEFSGRISHGLQATFAEHVEAIRGFLEQVDPETGYIEDD